MKYYETPRNTDNTRKDYYDSLLEFANKDFPHTKIGLDYIDELGYPLTSSNHQIVLLSNQLLSTEDEFKLSRCTFLVLNTIKITGILFEVNPSKPLVLMQHGYVGTPELMANVYEDRNSYNYNDIVKRIIDNGINVFCPQLLMWSIENYGIEYSREKLDESLKKKGSSIVSVETYCLKEILYYYKPIYKTLYMFGMSYGAFYTYHVSLVSNDVKRYWACSYPITNLHFKEMMWLSPLKNKIINAFTSKDLYITFGDHDPIIDYPETNKLKEELNDKEKIIVFNGDHEIYKDNNFLKTLLK